jgi:hypothetical protein
VVLFNRLLSAAPILRTSEQNQNVSTIEERGVAACRELSEPCSVVAETAEKNVAMVDMLRTLSESRFCSYRIAGIPVFSISSIRKRRHLLHTIFVEELEGFHDII